MAISSMQWNSVRALRSGVSFIAICTFAAAAPAFAQDAPKPTTTNPNAAKPDLSNTVGQTQQSDQAPAPSDTVSNSTTPPNQSRNAIIITGIRQSLANAQQIKRNSDTVVDAITAQDIGALPDRSVTEALQRVPGVEINRFAGSNDPDHFSVEGSGVTVRGLTFVRSEFNGRDTFSTGVYGQAINFSDVPPELLGSVEVYKNATADMIEGGLAGTVNLNTRLPFDKKGLQIAFDAEANYGDMRKKWTPTGSFLISDNWDTGIGRIGLLADVAYSQLKSRSDGIQVTNFQGRDNTIVTGSDNSGNVCRNPLPSNTNTVNLPPAGSPCGTSEVTPTGTTPVDNFADYMPLAYAPLGGQFRTQDYNRVRKGFAAAAQWESLDRRATLTAQFLRTDSSNKWGEHTFESAPDLSEYNTYPIGCQENTNGPNGSTRAECPVGSFTNYQYNGDNVFESGYITYPGGGWRGSAPGNGAGQGAIAAVNGAIIPAGGVQQSLSTRQVDDRNIVQDQGLNFKFNPTPHWAINLDADYTKAQHDTLDVSVFGSTFADEELDLTGNLPVVIPHKPNTLTYSWGSPNPALTSMTDQQYFSNPNAEFWRAAMDHIEHSSGHEYAFKGDVAYKFLDEVPFLKQLKAGARFADRDQTIRYSAYNWGALSEVWSGNAPVSIAQGGLQNATFFDFPNFFRGETPGPVGGYYYNGDLIGNYLGSSSFFEQIANIWKTTNGATAGTWVPLADRPGAVAGSPFLPSEIQRVRQKDKDAYVMLNFGQDDPIFGNVRLDGNVGVRYVDTVVNSNGAIQIPDNATLNINQSYTARCTATSAPSNLPPGIVIGQPGGICLLGPAGYAQLQQWANGAVTPIAVRNHYTFWLPSLNLKFGLSRDLIMRFAVSKVMTRPDIASARPSFSATYSSSNDSILFNIGNPNLKPATAWQADLTAEWYFARVGSLTFDLFAKNVKNFFYANLLQQNFTNNGVTLPVDIRVPSNYSGEGKIRGFEVAYQQTFNFLPKPLDGLGVEANYTYIKSKGLPNSFLNGGAADNPSPNGFSNATGNLPLEQLSKHNVNLTAFYEKGPISLRVAYNWRSRFLLTAADVIFPYDPIFNEATGQLDASFFYSLTSNLKFGVQAVNLLNEVTKTSQMFTLSGLMGPRSYFMNDRRYSVILRGTFGGSAHAAPPPPPAPLPPPLPATQTCPDGSVVAATATCPPPPPPPAPPPPPPAPERGQ